MCIRDRYKADPGVVKQLGILRELFGMAERIIVATDAGREEMCIRDRFGI